MRIVVTGGSGKAGSWVVTHLREAGHDVLNVDLQRDDSEPGLCLVADLSDSGQCFEALSGSDGVVHLAAIAAPGIRTDAETFRVNTMSTYNVFAAAEAHGVDRVVYASSETVLGLPFDELRHSHPSTKHIPCGPRRAPASRCRAPRSSSSLMRPWVRPTTASSNGGCGTSQRAPTTTPYTWPCAIRPGRMDAVGTSRA